MVGEEIKYSDRIRIQKKIRELSEVLDINSENLTLLNESGNTFFIAGANQQAAQDIPSYLSGVEIEAKFCEAGSNNDISEKVGGKVGGIIITFGKDAPLEEIIYPALKKYHESLKENLSPEKNGRSRY